MLRQVNNVMLAQTLDKFEIKNFEIVVGIITFCIIFSTNDVIKILLLTLVLA